MNDIILSMENITKTYPGVVALNNINIEFIRNEIHGLVGENGAGKSTLVKIIAGAIVPTSGKFVINGDSYDSITPKRAKEYGIETIYQEFNLVESLSVAENIFLGDFPGNKVVVNFNEMLERSKEIFAEMGVDIDPKAPVENLTTANRQLVEIAKSLVRNVRLLIMDEPTAPLTLHETELLFKIIKRLKDKGVTIIYITHRMNELFELTDRLTVFRDGEKIKTLQTKETDPHEIINMMVGREISTTYPEHEAQIGEKILEVKNLTGKNFTNVSFELHRGEILGFAGLVGAGRTEIMRAVFGADPRISGQVILKDREVFIKKPKQAIKHRIAYLPEDRKIHSVLLSQTIKSNISLPILRKLSRAGVVNNTKETSVASENCSKLNIKTPSLNQMVGNLSGGNQQKVAVGKWLASDSEIIIFDEPTRGIDVGAKQEIYQLLIELAKEGKAIIMVSSEMEELMGLADRIIVLHEGRITGMIDAREKFDSELIMEYAIAE